MTQELSPEAPEANAQQRPALAPGFLAWLRRRFVALRPRTTKHWALYSLLLVLALFVLFEWRSTTIYSAQVVVVPRTDELVVGINPTTERLDFGDLSQNSSQTRTVRLENGSGLPVRVTIIITGDIGPLIKLSDAFFTLDGGETRDVEFTLVVPPNAEPKKYSGRVMIVRMPWPPWP